MPAPMPPAPGKDDLDGTWNYLQEGISRIMNNLEDGLERNSYMGLYTSVHNFCTSQKAVDPSRPVHLVTTHKGAHLLGEDLYQYLIGFLKKHLASLKKTLQSHTDEALLAYYIREWKRYTTAAKYINNLFSYLNRHWVKREVDEGKREIYDVYTLHLVRWKVDLFEGVHDRVIASVLGMVEKQRNGETIEQGMIKSIVDSFVSLGLDETDPRKSTLDVYRVHFEKPFLLATERFYQAESKQFVAENTVIEYMQKAESRVEEEKERVGLYLHPDIMPALMQTCQKVLIAEHAPLLRDEFQNLLDHHRQRDLARMYKLLSRITDGLEPLRTRFEAHVRKAGLVAVAKVAADGDELEGKVYVDALLAVYTQYRTLVDEAFLGETEFVKSLDNACREFVNRNEVCKSGSTRSPELLAKYADQLLRKSTKNAEESDLEHALTQIMTIFKYIEDKDVYQKFYSRMLAKRLVHHGSVSDDAETSMISKLKEACGFEYTNKLQRMFQDMQISKDLNAQYRLLLDQALDDDDRPRTVDTQYSILGTGFWPLQPANTPFIPPDVIAKTYERFQRFYFDKHSGRKLTWLWHLCKGEIKANYMQTGGGGGAKVPYTFQVSTYQMAILLLFNDHDVVTYADMEKATALARDMLEPSLSVFLKAKVLLMDTPAGSSRAGGGGGQPEIVAGSTFRLNLQFKSKKLRVNLNFAVKSEQKQEVEATHKTIEEDRKLLMQSAIVRIMKSRKKMKHVQLVQEAISQIRTRFTPKVPDIKRCIDILLEKEYLERLEGEELGYLA